MNDTTVAIIHGAIIMIIGTILSFVLSDIGEFGFAYLSILIAISMNFVFYWLSEISNRNIIVKIETEDQPLKLKENNMKKIKSRWVQGTIFGVVLTIFTYFICWIIYH